MLDPILQPVSRDQLVKLAEGRAGAGERRQIVRRLVAQAARNQVTAGLDPFMGEPVPEAAYDLALKRAFERACRLHEELNGEEASERFEGMMPVVAGYSASEPSARRA
ncbi:MAG TPA: hypothetical protein VLX28_18215 [Thermoanaerobaculia bacterium]|nr:hypothetical protein [Thermoanaerobaculia bacterium]